ncbi:MAG: ArsR family transcriptional regulator, arsenate/arsenite/antimonite-responsive transcriptional [Frankiaceae bacterium]|jgi:ArsR family transcriptional regulator|nr:ArsR family transcriptional regulator, arsenate/arsenite/antimonite-responsive transcriptional [Frankiaceae bacterium]
MSPAVRAVADPVRWRILGALAAEDLCVCHLTADLGLAQPLVSHHLRVLREAGLVEAERAGRWTYYRLRRAALAAAAREVAGLGRGTARAGRRPCC